MDANKYGNVKGMYGVAKSNFMKWIKEETTFNFAFIFHRNNIQCREYANAHRMSNAYYTRFKVYYAISDENSQLILSTFTIYEQYSFSCLNQTIYFP